VVPVYVFVAPFHGDRPLANLYDAVTAIYFSLLPGLLTLSLSAYLLTMAYRRLRRSGLAGLHVPSLGPDWGAIWCFLLLGALGTALFHPNIIGHGIAHAACFPSSIVAACLAWGVLGRAPKRTAVLVCAGMVAEFVLMFWSHCWMADNRPEVLDPNLSNPWYKDNARIDFLFDQLEAGRYVFLAAAVMVEAILVVWLFHWWRAKDPTCKRGARIFPGADGRRDELDTRPLAP
jgi:hypothetical protein